MSPPATGDARGAVAIFAAKVHFVLVSYAVVFVLTRLLTPAEYGRWFVANGVVGLLGSMLVAATAQSMSRHVAQHPSQQADVRRTGLRVHAAVGAVASAGLATAAVPLARLLRDPDLVPLFLVVAPIPFLYSLYAAHVGVFNGRRQFLRQAGFDAGFATLKSVLMVAAAALGLGAFGVLGGFTLTALLVLAPAAALSSGGPAGDRPFPVRSFLGFSIPTIAFVAIVNLPLHLDALLVEHHLGSEQVGVYGAALQVARIPYQLCVAISFVAFPFLAAPEASRTPEATRRVAERALLYALVIGGVPAALVAGSGDDVIPLLVGQKLAAAGPLLRVLAPALLGYTLLHLCCTMLVSLGRPRAALLAAAATALAQGVLVGWRVPAAAAEAASGGGASGALSAAAAGTLAAVAAGCVASGFLLVRAARLRGSWRFAAMAGLLAALAGASAAWESRGAWLVVEMAALGAAGALAVVALRIVPLSDLLDLRAGPRSPAAGAASP